MPLISDDYRKMNEGLHASRPTYGASGKRWAEKIKALGFSDILDYGCGKSTLKNALSGFDFDIKEYDPAIPGKDKMPSPADLVVCTDVLEHIEPDYIDDVLDHIAELSISKALLVIATRPANKTLPDGRNAHLIIEPYEWWEDKLKELFYIDEVQEDASQPGEFMVIVRAK